MVCIVEACFYTNLEILALFFLYPMSNSSCVSTHVLLELRSQCLKSGDGNLLCCSQNLADLNQECEVSLMICVKANKKISKTFPAEMI